MPLDRVQALLAIPLLLLWRCDLYGWYGRSQEGNQDSVSETQRPNQNFKKYRNKNYNFSFGYPQNWGIYQGFDGNGVSLYPFPKAKSTTRPTIGVGGSVGQPSDKIESRPRSLQEDFEFLLRAMKNGPDPAVNVKVVSNESTSLKGLPAIVATIEFERGEQKESWVMKEILIHTADDSVTYHLSLICHPEQLQILAKSFNQLVKTFRILGPPA